MDVKLGLGNRKKESRNIAEVALYVPDDLAKKIETFSGANGMGIRESYVELLSKGLSSSLAREYLDLLHLNRYLKTAQHYSEFAKDNLDLRELVETVRRENDRMKRILFAKGLLRNVAGENSK